MARKVDVQVVNEGSIFLFRPMTKRAERWISKNVATEPWQWLGRSLAVDHRFAFDLAEGMQGDGLTLI